jgi:hypothetical protein
MYKNVNEIHIFLQLKHPLHYSTKIFIVNILLRNIPRLRTNNYGVILSNLLGIVLVMTTSRAGGLR